MAKYKYSFFNHFIIVMQMNYVFTYCISDYSFLKGAMMKCGTTTISIKKPTKESYFIYLFGSTQNGLSSKQKIKNCRHGISNRFLAGLRYTRTCYRDQHAFTLALSLNQTLSNLINLMVFVLFGLSCFLGFCGVYIQSLAITKKLIHI